MIEQMLNSMVEKYRKVHIQRAFFLEAVSFILETELNEEEMYKFKSRLCMTFMDLVQPDSLIHDDSEAMILKNILEFMERDQLVKDLKKEME